MVESSKMGSSNSMNLPLKCWKIKSSPVDFTGLESATFLAIYESPFLQLISTPVGFSTKSVTHALIQVMFGLAGINSSKK